MSLRGTREDHARAAERFLVRAWRLAEDAHRHFEEGQIGAGWYDYSRALMAWGSYLAESNYSGRNEDEDRALKLLKRTERSFKSLARIP